MLVDWKIQMFGKRIPFPKAYPAVSTVWLDSEKCGGRVLSVDKISMAPTDLTSDRLLAQISRGRYMRLARM